MPSEHHHTIHHPKNRKCALFKLQIHAFNLLYLLHAASVVLNAGCKKKRNQKSEGIKFQELNKFSLSFFPLDDYLLITFDTDLYSAFTI